MAAEPSAESPTALRRRLAREADLARLLDPDAEPILSEAEAEALSKDIRRWRDESANPR